MSEDESFSVPAGASTASITQMFSTPLARVLCPYADEWNGRLSACAVEQADKGRDFGYKREAPDLSAWGEPAADGLTRWVGGICRQLVEKLTGRCLAEAYALSRGREGGGAGEALVGITALRSWASVYRRGDRHEPHFHPNTAWSAIYYVAGDGGCELDLFDPRPFVGYFDPGIALAGEDQRVRLRCMPGELVLFPGWLRHAVPDVQDDGVRISLSWNLNYLIRKEPAPA
ncbi:putative 2OG-Fe(II) oxygenase [Streptomyces sp. NPDC004752]